MALISRVTTSSPNLDPAEHNTNMGGGKKKTLDGATCLINITLDYIMISNWFTVRKHGPDHVF